MPDVSSYAQLGRAWEQAIQQYRPPWLSGRWAALGICAPSWRDWEFAQFVLVLHADEATFSAALLMPEAQYRGVYCLETEAQMAYQQLRPFVDGLRPARRKEPA
jgi:hypothetical protein